MPARICVQETCGITPTIDPITGELILDLDLHPFGGIECAEPDGLYVNRFGTSAAVPAASLDPACVQQIGVTDTNALFVPTRPVTAFPIGPGSPTLFSTAGDHPSLNGSYTNPTTCDQLIRIVCAQPQVNVDTAPIGAITTNAERRQRMSSTPYIKLDLPNINGVTTLFNRNDYYFHADEAGSEIQWYSHLQNLVHLSGGQTVNYEIGITRGLLFQMQSISFTALRCWIEVYPDALAVPEP